MAKLRVGGKLWLPQRMEDEQTKSNDKATHRGMNACQPDRDADACIGIPRFYFQSGRFSPHRSNFLQCWTQNLPMPDIWMRR